MNDMTQARALELFEYNAATGSLRWRVAKARRIHIGDEAGYRNEQGRVFVRVDGRKYPAHHIAILIATGGFPVGNVRHKDDDHTNNALRNLQWEK